MINATKVDKEDDAAWMARVTRDASAASDLDKEKRQRAAARAQDGRKLHGIKP